MTERRTPHDGKPYYCRLCGAGYFEFMACEDEDCLLEDEADARQRASDALGEGGAATEANPEQRLENSDARK